MLSTLVNHNADIKLLVEKGYAVSVDSGYLVIRDIPYLDKDKNLRIGAIVSKLVYTDKVKTQIQDHQILFCGAHPCELDGTEIKNLGGGRTTLSLSSPDLVVERTFSNRPAEGFRNHYDKIESYVTIISGPAINFHKANPFTFRTVEPRNDSVFNYADTLTSRAEIGDLNHSFNEEKVAIIGLGGTGSYLLDFLAKTPVGEIRGFDYDWFHVHNAYRSPGKLEEAELGKLKSYVYQQRYGSFHKGISINSRPILSDSADDLRGITFAFVCVDKGSARKEIVELLMKLNIPFIDVGMGLSRDTGSISGTLRTSYFPAGSSAEMIPDRAVPVTDIVDDVYHNNIQISELNALNASIAIIKYKQLKNFYADDARGGHILFNLDNLQAFAQ